MPFKGNCQANADLCYFAVKNPIKMYKNNQSWADHWKAHFSAHFKQKPAFQLICGPEAQINPRPWEKAEFHDNTISFQLKCGPGA